MSPQPMRGISVLEVAEFTFAPSAAAILADWGADVVKVEHATRGDAQRGVGRGAGGTMNHSFHPLMEHANRGKRSIGLDIKTDGGREILTRLLTGADVFVTNALPSSRRRLRIDVDDIRAINERVIYVRGSAFGPRGPEATEGGYDVSVYWSRGASAYGATPADAERVADQPAGAYGDSLGGMALAGGIAAALFERERTGHPSVVDVSLLSLATWAMGLSVTSALLTGEDPVWSTLGDPPCRPNNPLVGTFRTADDRFVNFTMLQPGRYWADVCAHIGRTDLADDERFATPESIMDNAEAGGIAVRDAIRAKPLSHWVEVFQTMKGQWAAVQSPLQLAADQQVRENGYIVPIVDAEGHRREIVANPVQFDEEPVALRRGPLFAEHTDEIVRSLGYDEDELIDFKIKGAIT